MTDMFTLYSIWAQVSINFQTTNGLTKIPLYSTKHLKKCRNEISSLVIRAAVRDVDHPDEPNQNIENLGTMC